MKSSYSSNFKIIEFNFYHLFLIKHSAFRQEREVEEGQLLTMTGKAEPAGGVLLA